MPWRVALLMRTGRLRRRVRKLLGRPEPSAAATLHAGAAPVHAADSPWRRLMAITMAESPQLTVTDTRVFSRAELARIAAPMLLLIGEYERLYDPAETLRRARALKPGIEAEMVLGADHIAAMAQPDWVNARVLRFLSSSAPH
jgi:pimeloyl-ACP methyl ester carboxylesterase